VIGGQDAAPVAIDVPVIRKLGHRLILDDLEEHGVTRHNPCLARLPEEAFLSTADARRATRAGRVAR
jgi:hypothetical protein